MHFSLQHIYFSVLSKIIMFKHLMAFKEKIDRRKNRSEIRIYIYYILKEQRNESAVAFCMRFIQSKMRMHFWLAHF